MKITKYEHSCVVLEKEGQKLVFDPVEIEKSLPKFDNVTAVIVTHKHGDHLQLEQIEKILASNPEAKLITTRDAAVQFDETLIGETGKTLQLGAFSLKFFGRDHAAIIPNEIPCENLGVMVDEKLINPSDSFDLPDGADTSDKVLLVANVAPWCKIADAMQYVEKAKAKMVIPVHDGLLSEFGKRIYNGCLERACESVGSELMALKCGNSIDL